jgi:LysM repeat protein
MKRVILLLIVVVMTALFAASAIFGQAVNGLQDPSMEGEYTNRGRADFNIPAAWNIWYAESPRTESWMNLQPVAFPHNGPGPNPYDGARALNLNKGYATFTAAVYQQVAVTPNSSVTGSANGYLHTCNVPTGGTDCGSAVESGAYLRVGIDPNGGTNPLDSDVVWSANAFPHDRWQNISVTATTTGPTATLFLWSSQQWPAQLNNTYWDAAAMTGGVTGGSPIAGAPDSPAATVAPTAPPFVGFVQPQAPQADGSIIHTVQAGDTIDSIAFAYGVSRDDILQQNNISNGRYILVGQELIIQPAGSVEVEGSADVPAPTQQSGSSGLATNTPPGSTAATPSGGAGVVISTNPLTSLQILPDGSVAHVVQDGETFDSIAFNNGLTRAELMELNDITDPSTVVAGQSLIVRAAPTGVNVTSEDAEATPEVELIEPVATQEATAEPQPTEVAMLPQDAPPAPIISITTGDVVPAVDIASAPAQVCVMMFEDVNQNRLQEVGEAFLPAGSIMLISNGSVFADYATTGEDEPYCFTDLPAGDYLASAVPPSGYGLTTPEQLTVRPAPGWTINLGFGAAEGVTPATVPPPTGDTTADTTAQTGVTPENPLWDNLGYLAFGLAGVVVVLGAGITLAMRGR